ncbi:triose-phosphate isomerase [Ventosimonas gracilis]|uniref:Triosephosphate isomerase n=1 Tax=Ventosimonas gracilis TaxID=1680762 RepID=A0A139SVX2_9GAMM|nr:triose-phosphate isomerase [Ventosimonas gracilis]KXU38729.1 triose-phosphate isomerase [Ventosimonas gracilis]
MRRPLVAANWKMHGTRESVNALLAGLFQPLSTDCADILLFPAYLHIGQVAKALTGTTAALGAQNCAEQAEEGALTGEIAPCQLKDAGCHWVLLGHSERRLQLGETDAQIVRKFAAAQSAGLRPLLCVGETQSQREAGETLKVVTQQLSAVIDVLGIDAFAQAALAYEPVWAIGSGLSASPEQAQEVHAAIRTQLAGYSAEIAKKVRILYGGSVKAANAAELFAMQDIDGGLVGGASLNAQEFGAICRAALGS